MRRWRRAMTAGLFEPTRRPCDALDRLPAAAGGDVAVVLDHLLGGGEASRPRASASRCAARGCGTRPRSSATTRPGSGRMLGQGAGGRREDQGERSCQEGTARQHERRLFPVRGDRQGSRGREPASPPLPAISAGIGLRNGIENEEHRGRFMANRLGRHPLCLATASDAYVTLECSLEDTLLREELGRSSLVRYCRLSARPAMRLAR